MSAPEREAKGKGRGAGLGRIWSSMAYTSQRRLVFAVALTWASLAGLVLTALADSVRPGSGRVLLAPIELALATTAALLAHRAMRTRDERRLASRSVLDRKEQLQEDLERVWTRLDQLELSGERLAEEKLRSLRLFEVRLAELRDPARNGARDAML